jgi:hypothetical protein
MIAAFRDSLVALNATLSGLFITDAIHDGREAAVCGMNKSKTSAIHSDKHSRCKKKG